MLPSGSTLALMSMLTVSGTGPLSLSSVALAMGGSPVAPPIRTTALCLVERLSALVNGLGPDPVDPRVVQGEGCRCAREATRASRAVLRAQPTGPRPLGPVSGLVAGKLTVIVLPAGASVGETVRVPDGGWPGSERARPSRSCGLEPILPGRPPPRRRTGRSPFARQTGR